MALRSPLLDMDLRPFVEEAVASLGYFQPGIVDWMIAMMRAAAERGADLNQVKDDGWIPHLTDKGREHPGHGLMTTYRRARLQARDAANRRRILPLFPQLLRAAIFHKAPVSACQTACDADESFWSLPPELPLPGCDREACACTWHGVTGQELKRRGIDHLDLLTPPARP